MNTRQDLAVLLVEDNPDDATLILLELKRGGFDVEGLRVDTPAALEEALSAEAWDLILSDHSLPGFTSHDVLSLLTQRQIEVPCIIVSGAIGEEAAVELLQEGAFSYVNKNGLYRLVPAVTRAFREVEAKRAALAAERALRESERELRELNDTLEQRVQQRTRELIEQNSLLDAALNTLKDVFYILDADMRLLRWNRELRVTSGLDDSRIAARKLVDFVLQDDREVVEQWQHDVIELGSASTEVGFRVAGEYAPFELSGTVLRDSSGELTGMCGIATNVTARRRTEQQLKQAIRAVIDDATWFAQSVMEKMDHLPGVGGEPQATVQLTPREREVVELIARGFDNQQIAGELSISYPTVRNYVTRLYDKLEVNSRAQAVVWARERGFGQS